MLRNLRRGLHLLLVCTVLAVSANSWPLHAQGTVKPATPRKAPTKAPVRPAAPKPAAKPASKTAEATPAPAPQPVVVVEDLRFKTSYATGSMKTESVTYLKGDRERFEFTDMVLLKQHDLKRMIQISRGANTYLIVPDGATAIPAAAGTAGAVTPPKPAGVVTVTTTIVDTGERKTAFGLQARHVKTVMDKQPMPGACDQTKQRIETDGWYIDTPKAFIGRSPQEAPASPAAGGCADEVKAVLSGDPKTLGFPIGYAMTMAGENGSPNLVSMDVTELEVATLDPALFDIPTGMTEAGNIGALSKALSDANEVKLAKADGSPTAGDKLPGAIRIGVPELTNKTTQTIDTRALRARLIADLVDAKIDAVPLAAAPQAELQQRATERAYDYLLIAEVTELKVSKVGRLGGVVKAASKVAGTASDKEPTEAVLAIKLIQPDGKSRLSTTSKGKDGGGLDMKTGIGLAKFAGSMYVGMLTGRTMMSALNSMTAGNLSGMGMVGSPALRNMQMRGLGAGLDPTAGAASFLVQQAMAADNAAAGSPGQTAPSYDAALGDALGDTVKAVAESLKKSDASKKK